MHEQSDTTGRDGADQQTDADRASKRGDGAPPPPPPPGGGAPPPAPPAAAPPSLGQPAPWPGPASGRQARPWRWPDVVLGVVVAFGPQVLLYLAAPSSGAVESDTTMETVTLSGAAAVLISTLSLYGWQVAAAWLFSLRVSRTGLAGWGFRRPTGAFFWTIPVALAASYAVSAVHQALVDPPPQDIVEQFPRSVAGGALFVVIAVVFAPLFEEIFFRGFVHRGLRNSWGWWPAALTSAAVFSLAHFQITVFVPIFVLGVGLAWVYERTGSLWTSIAMHAVFNGLSVLAWALGAV